MNDDSTAPMGERRGGSGGGTADRPGAGRGTGGDARPPGGDAPAPGGEERRTRPGGASAAARSAARRRTLAGPRAEDPAATKSDRTRALILETALRLFRERGYERTTMRAIAAEAGVSVGNAYYYFKGKEFLIQGFYDRLTHEHADLARERMAGQDDFAERLRTAVDAWIDTATPYHDFAGQFFRNAADPDSALSPFSAESHPARDTAVGVFREVLDGSRIGPRLDPELDVLLPDLLWLHLMVVVLYWVFDRTEDTARTRAFVARCSPLVGRIVVLSRYRVIRPLVREAVALVREFVLPTLGSRAAAGPAGGGGS